MNNDNELLLRIKSLINKHGGNLKLANAIEEEWSRIPTLMRFRARGRVYTFYKPWSEAELFFLNYHKESLPIRKIATKLGRTYKSVHDKVYRSRNI